MEQTGSDEFQERILTAFKQLDRSGDGEVSKDEVAKVLSIIDPARWTTEKVEDLFTEYGIKKDDAVKVEEFVKWIFTEGAAEAKQLRMPAVLSTHQFSSTIVDASAQAVYDLIRPLTFKWLSNVSSAAPDADNKDVINVAYSDHTVQAIQLMEYSDLDLVVGWEVISSDPPTHCASQVHTIRCLRITDTQRCCITWNTDFSQDATLEVIHDSKWKKAEAFESLKRMFPERAK